MVKFSLKNKLLFAFISYGIALVIASGFIIFKMDEADVKSFSIEKAFEMFMEREQSFKYYIRDVDLKLKAVANAAVFKKYCSDATYKQNVEELFLNIATTSDNIMQLRFIDSNGSEQVRIDRDSHGSVPYSISSEKLQNKTNRYYFNNIMSLNTEEFWYSKIDLNVEHGVIEKPIKPVLRVGTPVFHNDKKIGILIINIFMNQFLHELNKSIHYDIYLLDKDGYALLEPAHNRCWSRYLQNATRLENVFGNEFTKILKNEEYFGSTFYSKKIFLNNGEEIRMILQPKDDVLQKRSDENLKQLFLVMFGIIMLSFPIAYLLSKRSSQLQAKLTKRTNEQNVLLSLFDLGDEVLFKWNNDEHWSVASVSKSVQHLLGYSKEEFESQKVIYAECIHKDDLQKVIAEVTQAVEKNEYYFAHEPYRIITKDTKVKWILDNTVIVRDENSEVTHFVGYLSDITELKTKEFELQRLSQTDKLTQIYNRTYLDTFLATQETRFKRYKETCSVILIDIDYFKDVNDEYGHVTGDSVLIEFAQLLKQSLRLGDIVGRWGGEEFLIILPHANSIEAAIVAEKLRLKIQNHHFLIIRHKTASFGVATIKENMEFEEFVEVADKALYASKESGRNCVSSAP